MDNNSGPNEQKTTVKLEADHSIFVLLLVLDVWVILLVYLLFVLFLFLKFKNP